MIPTTIDDRGRERRGNWIQLVSGRPFWPLDPRPDEICVQDVAHALSMLCRYGGHCRKFYSVAEHSVYVSYCVSPASALWGLIHDAAEAFLVDVPRPVKKMLPLYREIEYRLLLCVAERFGLPAEMPDEVKRVDNGILHVEREQLLAPSLMEWGDPQAGPSTRLPLITVVGHTPQAARRLFLYRYTEITGEVEIF